MAAPCNRCQGLLLSWDAVNSDDAICQYCGSQSIVRVFPALFQQRAAPASATAAADGEAACYDHPAKRAVAHCAQCGRFVCQLCAVEFRGGVWCPSCFAAGHTQKREAHLEQTRMLWDSVALSCSVLPLLMWPSTIVTAPAAIFVALRYWNRPLGLVRRNRWRAVLAIVLGAAQIGGWVWFIVYLVQRAGVRP